MEQLTEYLQKILAEKPIRIVLSNPLDKLCKFTKMVLTYKVDFYQIEKFTAKQVFHQTVKENEMFDETPA